ncbi:MAG: 3-methyl-2-oxobutanoate dehydrogenase subunit VorB [Candidatus Eremiobacterota bacterium]
MSKVLIKGNDAAVLGAILAGCTAYYGYPITPASEIAHAAAKNFPLLGRTFVQAESEVAAINMVYGAASAGQRCMTASSGPGISLKQEGVSYCAGAELPCVIVDIVRGGPGLGNIGPEQGDYNQIVKGGGHGNYKVIVLSPASSQEMCDLTMLAFELADKYRTPVYVLTDGVIGQMMEPVDVPSPVKDLPEKDWAVKGNADTASNLITSIYMDHEDLEQHILKLDRKYKEIEEKEVRYEEYLMEDAEIALVGYSVISRILRTVVDKLREKGIKAGLMRPVTLWPFPSKRIGELSEKVKHFFVVEMSTGQLLYDVKLAVNGKKPVHLYYRLGGMVPSTEEIIKKVEEVR